MQSVTAHTLLRSVVSLATFVLVLSLGVALLDSIILVPGDIVLSGVCDFGRHMVVLMLIGGLIGGTAMVASRAVSDLLG